VQAPVLFFCPTLSLRFNVLSFFVEVGTLSLNLGDASDRVLLAASQRFEFSSKLLFGFR
jgi:hypothetical protein